MQTHHRAFFLSLASEELTLRMNVRHSTALASEIAHVTHAAAVDEAVVDEDLDVLASNRSAAGAQRGAAQRLRGA